MLVEADAIDLEEFEKELDELQELQDMPDLLAPTDQILDTPERNSVSRYYCS